MKANAKGGPLRSGLPAGFRSALTWAAFLLFLGYGWLYVFWDGPLRELFWDQALMAPFVRTVLGMDWSDFVTDLEVEARIQLFTVVCGMLLWLAALAVLLPKRLFYLAWPPVLFAALILSLDGVVQMRNGFPAWAVGMEFMARWATPVLWLWIRWKGSLPVQMMILRLAVAGTFVGHGLYASGLLPVPGHFVDMSMNSLGLAQEGAMHFLRVAGILDFVSAAGLFLSGPWNRWAAGYMIFWGLFTSLARIAGHWQVPDPFMLWGYWLFQTLLRAPHVLLPLALLLYFRQRPTRQVFRPFAPDPDPGV